MRGATASRQRMEEIFVESGVVKICGGLQGGDKSAGRGDSDASYQELPRSSRN